MAKLLTNRTAADIKNKWYSMKRKAAREELMDEELRQLAHPFKLSPLVPPKKPPSVAIKPTGTVDTSHGTESPNWNTEQSAFRAGYQPKDYSPSSVTPGVDQELGKVLPA